MILANQREGGSAATMLTVANTAAAGSFTEGLNASFGSTAGSAVTNAGTISLLAGGANNSSAMSVGVNTATAGAKSGTVAVNFVSDGSASSGLGLTALGQQTVDAQVMSSALRPPAQPYRRRMSWPTSASVKVFLRGPVDKQHSG